MSEWISVDDRQPEENGDYLVTVARRHSCPGCACAFVASTSFSRVNRPEWYQIHYEDGIVTHWMPLPEPARMR